MGQGTMRCEVLSVEGALNVRDIGGYAAGGGTDEVVKGRFIRAGSLSNLTASGIGTVRALGVTAVIDLRSSVEVSHMPDALAEDPHIRYIHIPMLDHIQSNLAQSISVFPTSMAEMYRNLLDSDGEKFRRIFAEMAREDNPVTLFHCTAGKDRTGLVAMLLLGLAGVSDGDIIEDYSWSEELLLPMERAGSGLPHFVFASAPETMAETLEHLHREYGSAAGYLTGCGVSREEQEALLKKLLVSHEKADGPC